MKHSLQTVLPEKSSESPLYAVPLGRLIDELGETQRKHDVWAPQINPHATRLALLKGELARRYANFAADKQDVVQGTQYQLVVTPREISHPITRTVKDKAWKLLKKLKKDPLEVFDVTLTALRASLGKEFVAAEVPEERTGPRKFHVTLLAPAAELRKAA